MFIITIIVVKIKRIFSIATHILHHGIILVILEDVQNSRIHKNVFLHTKMQQSPD